MKKLVIGLSILAIVVLAAWFFLFRKPPPPPTRFVLIVADALRADHLGCYGHERDLTPNIDAFAADSLVFTDVTAAGPWTLSSNPGLFTGRYPYEVFNYDKVKLLDNAITMAERFQAAGYKTAAFSAHPLITKTRGFDQGFDEFQEFDGPKDAVDNALLSRFLRWMPKNMAEPTFVLLYFYDPHIPYDPRPIPQTTAAKLKGARDYIRQGDIVNREGHRKPAIMENPQEKWECSLDEIDLLHELYEGDIAEEDIRIGQVLEALRGSKAVIAITSDHGEEWLEHGGLFHKEMLYQELLHVPLILRIPGRKAGVVTAPVSNLDLMPTLLEVAKIEPEPGLRGRSLLSDSFDEDRPLFSEARHVSADVRRYGVKEDSITVMHSLAGWPDDPPIPEGGRWECYNLEADPTQQETLSLDEYADLQEMLLAHEEKVFAFEAALAQKSPASEGIPEDLQEKLEALGYLGG